MDIERDLKDALRRRGAPPGFASRVMARIESGEAEAPAVYPQRKPWRAIAAAILLTAVLGGWAAHQESERRAGERARDEVLLALRITSEKLHEAREQVNDIGTNH